MQRRLGAGAHADERHAAQPGLDKPNVERQIQYARDERAAILHQNPILRMSYTEAKVQGE